MSKIKLSPAQAIALRDAEIIGNLYVIKAHAATVKALRNMGMVEAETFCLTVRGAVARTGLEDMNLSRGTSIYPYDLGDTDELFIIPPVRDDAPSNVVIDAPYWASNGPILDQLDSVPSECYWGDSAPIVAVWFDSVGNVEGVCPIHLEEIKANGYTFTMLPTTVATPATLRPVHVPLVGVRQSRPGWQGVEHIHASGCADIRKEMKRWGQSADDTFRYSDTCTLADLVSDNWADVASDTYGNDVMQSRDAWVDMVEWTNDDHSGLKIMPCAKGLDAGFCPAGTLYRSSQGYIMIEPQTGVTSCTECGEHIMSDDLSIPAQCEGGCDVCSHGNGLDCAACAEADEDAMESVDGPMTGQYDDYDYAGDEITFAMHDAGDHSRCDGSRGCTDTRTDEDMADTMDQPATVEAHLIITVADGVTVDLGWHTFTVPVGCEKSIPTLYGERNGEWKNGTANWDSVIRVVESYTE